MFKCYKCGHSVSGMKPVLMTVSTRAKTYPSRPTAYKVGDGVYKVDPGGVGYEIVKQVQVHDECPVYRGDGPLRAVEEAPVSAPVEVDFRTKEMAIFNSLINAMNEQAAK